VILEIEMAYRIRRNEHYRGKNEVVIAKIEGVYRGLEHLEQVVKEAGTFQFSNLLDGTILLYDKDLTKEEITADSTGQLAAAIIEMVQ
jgi:hypothetical protein